AAFLTKYASFVNLPAGLRGSVGHILFVPLGAILVVFFRLTLGVRVLGPFRSILLAVAFQITGVLLGLAFVTITVAAIAALRPLVKVLQLPYYGRISVLLSAVVLLVLMGILAGTWLQLDSLHRVARFPLIALCLMADGFGKTLAEEGMRSALWRGAMTVLV